MLARRGCHPVGMKRAALLVIDVQKAFHDPSWGPRNNPACEQNVAALIEGWRERGEPIVFVRHDSVEPGSTLRPGQPGNELQDVVSGEPDLLVAKSVNSAFHGEPDLEAWLRANEIERLVICYIQTTHIYETTDRLAGNLGFDTRFAINATHTFDLKARDGGTITADELARVTEANLDPEFCRVVTTAEDLAE